MTPAARLEMIGHALFGERWREPLARALHVDESTIRHAMTGRRPIADDHPIFDDARELVVARRAELDAVLDALEAGQPRTSLGPANNRG